MADPYSIHDERLHRIAEVIAGAVQNHPEVDDDTKAIIILCDGDRNEMATLGFESGREVVQRMASGLKFVAEQAGMCATVLWAGQN